MNGSFTAQISGWVTETKQRMEAVVKQSASDVIEIMQTPVAKGGNMPVDTGFLRSSLIVSLDGPRPTYRENPFTQAGAAPSWDMSVADIKIASAGLGKPIWATYTANYAGHVHYGANGRPGRLFVDLAAQKWVSIVHGNVRKLKSTVSSRTL